MLYSTLKQGKPFPFHNKLAIQLIQQSDLGDIIAMLDDERVNRYLFFAPADERFYRQYFHSILENTAASIANGSWPDNPTFIIRDQHGRYMGMTAVTQVPLLSGNHEVGYQLPAHAWGLGIATQACQMMTNIAFTELGSHKISADCFASNTGSYKTLEKCGYVLEGRQHQYYQSNNGFDDKLYYGLTVKQYLTHLRSS
ncbi:GNAT family N-acetyltransferase [Vibrio ostreicida]|uniref:GNAT family protein n=1 Tax=Vibrio ostreicida TaxID=526588 RepID=A0ABT8C0C6_9VIBR|nr:GNAT family protein [Vibrio ostreicida]MDN3612388.1 GNAT family protein [Vibrio ostreicida]NPD09841.1 GNAT family N-acetyltransferase [Vibrio ostreicida]